MIKKAVVLCGGLGTRLLPITKTIPKEMMLVFSKPAIEFCIEDLIKNGIEEILIVLGRNKECLENYFDHNIELEQRTFEKQKSFNANIYFLRQQEARGTGFATLKAKNFVGNSPFLLIYPDELTLHKSFSKTLLMAFKNNPSNLLPIRKIDIKESKNYGMVKIEKTPLGNKILKLVEKPEEKDCPSDICYLGGGLFLPEIFDFVDEKKSHKGEIFLTDAFDGLIKNNRLFGVFLNGKRLDIGTPLGLLKASILTAIENKKTKEDLQKFLKEEL